MEPPALDQRQAGIDESGHRREPAGGRSGPRAQGLLQGAIGIEIVARFEEQEPIRVETEARETVAVGHRVPLREDEERFARNLGEAPGDEGEGEPERRGFVSLGFGRDLVQMPEAEAAARQAAIDGVDSERQVLSRGDLHRLRDEARPQGGETRGRGFGRPWRCVGG